MPTTETPPEQQIADAALYTEWDAARHLHIPVWGVHAMSGHGVPHPEWFFERYWRRKVSEDQRPRLSFRRLTELYIRSAVIHAATEAWESEHPGRRSFGHWEDLWWFLDGNPAGTTGDPLWVDEYASRAAARLPGVNGERVQKFVLLYADRVDVVEGRPVRLFPFSRDPSPSAPRLVALNPRVRFGRPTLVGRGIPTDVIIDRFRGGDSAAFLAEDFDIPVEEIEEAIRYETRVSSLSLFPLIGW